MIQAQSIGYFSEVARTGSLRRAAENLLITPSAISRQIANLEEDLSASLFERSSRGMVLTEAGNALMCFVQENNAGIQRLRSTIDGLSGLSRGMVRISAVEATASNFLPTLMTEFSVQYPNIRFDVRVCGSQEIAEQVADDRSDIGLAFNVLSRDDLTMQGRIPQALHMICRPDHELAAKKSIEMSELEGFRVALPARSFGIRYLVDRAIERAGIKPILIYEADSLQLIKSIVRNSDAIAFMPPLTFEREADQGLIVSVALTDLASERSSIDIVTSAARKLPAAPRAFLGSLLSRIRGR